MPKICDPPTFIGGQMLNVGYSIVFRRSGGGANRFIASASNGGQGGAWLTQAQALANVSGAGFRGLIRGILAITIISGDPNFTVGIGNNEITNVALPANSGFVFGGISNEPYTYTFVGAFRRDGLADTGGDPPPTNCRCSQDSCRIECVGSTDGFCCIDHSLSNRLLQVLANL